MVTAYRTGNELAIALGHGKTDHKNALAAGEAQVCSFRKSVHIVNPRILPAGSDISALPAIVRLQARGVVVFVADITLARVKTVLPVIVGH